jgi:hypothetical protein
MEDSMQSTVPSGVKKELTVAEDVGLQLADHWVVSAQEDEGNDRVEDVEPHDFAVDGGDGGERSDVVVRASEEVGDQVVDHGIRVD